MIPAVLLVVLVAVAGVTQIVLHRRQLHNSTLSASADATVTFAAADTAVGQGLLAPFPHQQVGGDDRIAELHLTWTVTHPPCDLVAAVHVSSAWVYRAATQPSDNPQQWRQLRATRGQLDDSYQGYGIDAGHGSLDLLYTLAADGVEQVRPVRVLIIDTCGARQPVLSTVNSIGANG